MEVAVLQENPVFACVNKECNFVPGGVTARLHSVELKCLKDACGPSCETEDTCRQGRVLCLCEIMRT